MVDVLRLSCATQNENARNAAKKFASTLENLFIQYQNLLEEHVKLLEQCGDTNVSFVLRESQSQEGKSQNASCSSQLSTGSTDASNESVIEALPREVQSSDINFNVKEVSTTPQKTPRKQALDIVIQQSPVFSKRRVKPAKSDVAPNRRGISKMTRNDAVMLIRRHPSVLRQRFLGDDTKVEMEEESKRSGKVLAFDCNESADEIIGTPLASCSKKLSICGLVNVDTTLLSNGRKLRQSKLLFGPTEKDGDVTICEKPDVDLSETHVSQVLMNRREETLKVTSSGKPPDEEVIENSPNYSPHSKVLQRLKLKKKTPKKGPKKYTTDENIVTFDKVAKCSGKSPLKESNDCNISQFSPPVHSSTQKEFRSMDISESRSSPCFKSKRGDRDFLISPKSMVLANLHQSCEEDYQKFVAKVETSVDADETLKAQKRKFSESIGSCSTGEDETFFELEGKNPKTVRNIEDSDLKCDTSGKKKWSVSPTVKRSLLDSFDLPPDRQNDQNPLSGNKPSKCKTDRAQMEGFECWECKQFFDLKGLSEEEKKAKLNQLSRHRVVCQKRQETPAGFWDPMFPDTASSSYGDDT